MRRNEWLRCFWLTVHDGLLTIHAARWTASVKANVLSVKIMSFTPLFRPLVTFTILLGQSKRTIV
jgi:hypothetical protein